MFALLGLRQLYALMAGVLGRIAYLNVGLGLICAFIGVKLLLRALHGSGVGWAAEIPAWLSVLVVAAVLLATIAAGVIHGRRPLTAEERMMLERRFAIIDTDGNGMWQRDDYQLLAQRLCETFGHTADSAAGREVALALRALFDTMLSHMDANDDAQISRDEFVASLGRAIKDRMSFDTAVGAAAQTLIQMADQDGNGVLDAGEYARLAAVYGPRPTRLCGLSADSTKIATACWTRPSSRTRSASFSPAETPRARGNLTLGACNRPVVSPGS